MCFTLSNIDCSLSLFGLQRSNDFLLALRAELRRTFNGEPSTLAASIADSCGLPKLLRIPPKLLRRDDFFSMGDIVVWSSRASSAISMSFPEYSSMIFWREGRFRQDLYKQILDSSLGNFLIDYDQGQYAVVSAPEYIASNTFVGPAPTP